MSGFDDVADSTDWLNTPLAGLAPLESGLRCQVCKDFYATPMITSCSHTFCSICIRRYLSQEGKCPACNQQDQEMKLRRNWAIEELVAIFTKSREDILLYVRQPPRTPERQENDRPKKRRKIELAADAGERRNTRSQSKRAAASASQASQEAISTQEEIADSEDEGSVYQDESTAEVQTQARVKEPNDGLVQCPNCTRRMREASINAHLDRCLAGLPTSPEPKATTQSAVRAPPLSLAPRTKSPTVAAAKDRLPSINYALLPDVSLRKKLKELGIPNGGNKELMRRRHTEWMNLWNANCDSLTPKPKTALLRELDMWERTLGRQIERNATGATSGIMGKDFDRHGWVQNHTDDFNDLIKKARAKAKASKSLGEEKQEESEVQVQVNDSITKRNSNQHDQQLQDADMTGPPANGIGDEDERGDKPADQILTGVPSSLNHGKRTSRHFPTANWTSGNHAPSTSQSQPFINGESATPKKSETSKTIDLLSSPAGETSNAEATTILQDMPPFFG